MKEFEYFIISFLESNIENLKNSLAKIFSNNSNYEIYSDNSCELNSIYQGLSPQKGGSLPMRALIYAPIANESISVLYTNYSDGWETLVNRISKDLSIRCWMFYISSDANKYPKNGFEVIEGGKTIRKVASFKDWDKWEFVEVGEPIGFEDVLLYNKRNKKDRLRLESIVHLSKSYGMNFFENESFFETKKECLHIEELR